MTRTHLALAALMILWLGADARAQLSLVVQMDPLPSPYLSDWRSRPNTIRFVITNPTSSSISGRFQAYIEGDKRGRVAETKLDASIPPVVIPPGSHTFNAISARFIEEDAVRYIGSSKEEAEKSGRLPEDRFRLCVQFVGYDDPWAPLSNESCTSFEVRLLLPPSLIAPADRETVRAIPTFQWSIVPLGLGTFAHYELKVVELDPGQTNIASAIESNLPLIVRGTTMPVYQYMASDPVLEKGRSYAWRVRAFDPDGKMTFANKGFSEIRAFLYDPIVPPAIGGGVKPGVAPQISAAPIPPFSGLSYSYLPNFVFNNMTRAGGRLLTTFLKSHIPKARSIIEQSPAPSGGSKGFKLPVTPQVAPAQTQLGIQLATPAGKEATPLGGIHLKLYQCMKTNPQCIYYPFYIGGKMYDTRKLVATTTTQADGSFEFLFFATDSAGLIIQNTSVRCGGGEFAQIVTADVYRYYQIEVTDPHLCSPSDEFKIQPGEGADVGTIYSLVRWYNATIRVQDAVKGSTLNFMDVEVARLNRPFDVPPNEGELSPHQPSVFSSYVPGLQAIAKGKSSGNGEVKFRYLPINGGGSDKFQLIVTSPEQGAYYYAKKWRTFSVHFGFNEKDELDNNLPLAYTPIHNEDFDPSSLNAVIVAKVPPKNPRILGQVYRQDNPLQPVKNAQVQLWAWAGILPVQLKTVLTNDSGGFSFEDLNPTTNSAQFYFLKIVKYGFKDKVFPENLGTDAIRLDMGQQRHCGHVLIEPALVVTGRVVDELGRPVAANVRIGNGEFVHTKSYGIPAQAMNFYSPPPQNQMIQTVKNKTFTPSKALYALKLKQTPLLVLKEEFTSPAPYGFNWIYIVPDNMGMYYPETLAVILPQNAVDIGEFTVSIKLHRLAVRAVEMEFSQSQPKPVAKKKSGITAISYNLFIIPMPTLKVVQNARIRVNGQEPDSTDSGGTSYFAWSSPSDLAAIDIEGPPGSDFIPKQIQATVDESKGWNVMDVLLEEGGSITGTVKIGTVPIPGARVRLFDNPADPDASSAMTDGNGSYSLHRIPVGSHVFQAAKSKSQYVGDTAAASVKKGLATIVDFQLTSYNDLDITSLYGFPIEVSAIDSSGGAVKLSGSFVDLPSNGQFAPDDSNASLHFANVAVVASSTANPNGIPYAEPASSPLVTSVNSWNLSAWGLYKASQHDQSNGVRVRKQSDRGEIFGRVSIDPSSYTFYGGSVDFGSGRIGLAKSTSGPDRMTVPALTSDGSNPHADPSGFYAGDEAGNSLGFDYYDFPAVADSSLSRFNVDTLSLATVLHTDIPAILTPDLALDVGVIRIHKNSVEALSFTDTLSLPLEGTWKIRSNNWKIDNAGLTMSTGAVDAGPLDVTFTGMKVTPTQLLFGDFNLQELPVANVTEITVTGDAAFGVDGGTGSWTLAVAAKPGEESCGYIPGLPGFAAGQRIDFNNFYTRANGAQGFSVKSGNTVTLYKVGQYSINQFFPASGIIQVAGNLNLSIPNFPIKNFICSYTKSGGQLVFTPDPMSETISVNGVKIKLVTSGNGPQIFDNQGFHSKVTISEDGAVSFNSMLHRTLSKIEAVVDEGSEMPIGTAVKLADAEGEMHVNNNAWTNFWFEGDLISPNQSGRLRFDVVGEITANNQQIGVEDIETPFGDISLVYNFQQQRLEGNLHIEQELNGTKVEGDATLLVSGTGKGWYFFAGCSFEMPNPKYEGSAALLFGNWTLEAEQLNQFMEYSYKKKPLPSQFHTLNGFFFEGTVKFPPPVFCPNFDFDFGLVSAHLTCQIGANARLGMNFGPVNTYFVAFRGIGKLEAGIGASIIIACAGLTAGIEIEPNIEGMYQSDGTWYVMGDFPITLYGSTYAGWGICDSDCDGLCDKHTASASILLGLQAYVGSDDKYFRFYFK